MNTIRWLVSSLPRQVKALVAVLLIAISTLSGTIVYLYKVNERTNATHNARIAVLNDWYIHKLDSLSNIIIVEKEKSKQEVISKLEDVIKQQNKTLDMQQKHKGTQKSIISINNNVIQQNSQKIKQLQNEQRN